MTIPFPADIPTDVCTHFERITLALIEDGFDRYSADAILHRIRWHERIERGNRTFKVNDHWSAPLSRWFSARHPQVAKFFETRVRPAAPIRAYID